MVKTKSTLLSKIPQHHVQTEMESIILYRLGIFKNKMYELVELKKGKYPLHIHRNANSILYFILGKGIVYHGERRESYRSGTIVKIPKGTQHGFEVRTPTLFLSLQKPPIIDQQTEIIDLEYV